VRNGVSSGCPTRFAQFYGQALGLFYRDRITILIPAASSHLGVNLNPDRTPVHLLAVYVNVFTGATTLGHQSSPLVGV